MCVHLTSPLPKLKSAEWKTMIRETMILQKSSKKVTCLSSTKKKNIVSDHFLIVKSHFSTTPFYLHFGNRRLFRFNQPAALAAPGGAGVELRNVEDVEPGGGGRRCCCCSGLGRWNLGLPKFSPWKFSAEKPHGKKTYRTKILSQIWRWIPKTINRWRRVWSGVCYWGVRYVGIFWKRVVFEMVISGDLKFLLLMTGKIESFFVKGIVK